MSLCIDCRPIGNALTAVYASLEEGDGTAWISASSQILTHSK